MTVREVWTAGGTMQMTNIHHLCFEMAAEYGTPGNYVNGANIAGFTKGREPWWRSGSSEACGPGYTEAPRGAIPARHADPALHAGDRASSALDVFTE